MLKLYYEENGEKVLIASILTNHSMSIEDVLSITDTNMDEFAKQQGWDGWNYEALKIEV